MLQFVFYICAKMQKNLIKNRFGTKKFEFREDNQKRIPIWLQKGQFGEPKVVDPFYNRASLVRSQAEKKSVFEFKGKEFKDH